MKKYNIWCNKEISVEMDVVCKNKKELWDIVRQSVDFKNFGSDGDLVGITNSSPNVRITCFEPDTDTKWWIHNVSECNDEDYEDEEDDDEEDDEEDEDDEDEDDDEEEVGDTFTDGVDRNELKKSLKENHTKLLKDEIESVFMGVLGTYIGMGLVEIPTKTILEDYLDRLYWNCGLSIIELVGKGVRQEITKEEP